MFEIKTYYTVYNYIRLIWDNLVMDSKIRNLKQPLYTVDILKTL